MTSHVILMDRVKKKLNITIAVKNYYTKIVFSLLNIVFNLNLNFSRK